jgi:two-component system OmpR family response regulator
MQILLIEDDERVADHVVRGLREAAHFVDLARTGREGLIKAAAERFDLVILDRMLPEIDGLRIVHTIRATGDTTPILILSALGDVDERVKGLRAGGDDYLPKPFALSELIARVEVLGRRGPALAETQRLTVGDLVVDLLGHTVTRAGRRVELTRREFRILAYLMRNEGRVVTRSMLLEHVWDYSFDPQTNIIDQHVSRLRHKIDRDFPYPLIETVRGTGYVIRSPA